MAKLCPKRRLSTVKRDIKHKNIQRYRCKNCKHVFESKKYFNELRSKLRFEYVEHKQTQKQLADKYSLTPKGTVANRTKKVEILIN